MKYPSYIAASTIVAIGCLLSGCNRGKADAAAEAPPPLKVERVEESGAFQVEHPEQFALAKVGEHEAAPELNATGSVNPDVSRNIPVISIATGRVLEIHARLGDAVTEGELLMRVQSQDIAQAFSEYRKALSTEQLNRLQLDRSQLLFAKGAIARSNLEQAGATEEQSRIDVATAQDHLRVLGADAEHPSSIVDVRAPVSGVITDQEVTAAAG